MKKLLFALATIVTCLFAQASAQNTTYSWKCSNSNSVKTASPTTITFGDITWDQTWTSTGNNNGSRDGNSPQSLRYGSKKNPLNNLTFSSDFFAGKTIVSISINAKMPSNAATTFVANIDGTPVGDAISLPTSFGDCTFDNLNKTVSEKGTLELVFVNSNTTANVSSNGGVYLHSITIVYTEASSGTVTLGELTGKYGTTSVANDGECAVDPGTEFDFAAENAESITVAYEGSDGEHTNDYTGATATWTAPTTPGDYIVTVTAKLGEETKTLAFTLTVNAPATLGEVTGKYGTTSIANDGECAVDPGTEFEFAAENAESIKVEYLGSADDAEVVTNDYTGATATWTAPTTPGDYIVTVTAKLGEETKTLAFTLTVNAPALGDIVAKFGEYTVEPENDEFGVELGTVGEFTAENAESITVKCVEWTEGVDGEETTNTYTGATANWPIPEEVFHNYNVTVTAKLGDETKELKFFISVEPHSLGEISAKIGTEEIIDICFREEPYVVYTGTQIDITAPYAETIKVSHYIESDSYVDVDEQTFKKDAATWTVPSEPATYKVKIEAQLDDDQKVLDFYVTVKEPSSIDKPMTVAEALAECTADGPTGVYVKGIVTEVTTAYSSTFNNVSFKIADAADDAEVLLAYRTQWDESVTNAPADYNPVVGSSVIISGNLTIYNDVKEFADGNLIVKYIPVLGAITGKCDAVVIDKEGTYAVETGKTITFTAGNAETITIEYGEGQSETIEGSTAAWAVPATVGDYNVTVTATLGDDTKTLTFTLTVVEPKPVATFDFTVDGHNVDTFTDIAIKASSSNTNASANNLDGVKLYHSQPVIMWIDKGTGSNVPRWWEKKSETDLRVYSDNKLNIGVAKNGYRISSVEFTAGITDSKYNMSEEVTDGNGTTISGTWDGKVWYAAEPDAAAAATTLTSLQFTPTGTAVTGSIVVTYEKVEGAVTAIYGDKPAEAPVPTLEYDNSNNTISLSTTFGYQLWHKWSIKSRSTIQPLAQNVFTKAKGNEATITDLPSLSDLGSDQCILVTARSVDTDDSTNLKETAMYIYGDGTTGVDDIVADNVDGEVEYYNLQGVRVANPESGLYIRVQGKKATKVFVK